MDLDRALRLTALDTLLLFVVALPQAAAQLPAKADVTLHASVEAVVPGQPFELGVDFKLEPGWHLYWKDPGQSGMPPKIEWTLPPGFEVDPPRFPVPTRHTSAGITTNVLEGEPVLVLRVTPPAELDAPIVTLKGKVTYLACKDTCVPGRAEVTLELSVAAAGVEVKPANEELFQRARLALPKEQGRVVMLTPSLSATELKPGTDFELLLEVAIQHGFHIQSHKPTLPTLVKTAVLLENTPGVKFDAPQFPKPHMRKDRYLGALSEFTGTITIRIPGRVEEELPAGPLHFGGLFTSQACADSGTCLAAETIAFGLELPRGGEGATPVAVGDAGASVTTRGESDAAAVAPAAEVGDETSEEEAAVGGWLGRLGLPGLLIACFLYGLFLNATPCVLPLLSIKVLGFVQQAHESRRRTLLLGLAFGLGVILFFVALGLLAAAGTNLLQFPLVVIALCAVVTVLALSMLGVYTLQAPTAATKLDASLQREGIFTSFGKGALAPLLGFACTGPLLAGAFGWAAQQESHIAILGFLAAGLGMASPYMLLGANPNWLSFLPKPGNWMITFERIMGFLLLGMVVWLLHPITKQMSVIAFELTLLFLIGLGISCWVWGKITYSMSAGTRWRYRGGAGVIAVVGGVLAYGVALPLLKPAYEVPWQTWSLEAVEREVKAGRTVLVDFTAVWCTVCKANKFKAFNQSATGDKLKELGVVPLQGDYSEQDPAITVVLQQFNRLGPPLNLIYPADHPDKPIVLRTNLTLDYLLEKLDEAGPSRVMPQAEPSGRESP